MTSGISVIKLGGSAGVDVERFLVGLSAFREPYVLVHGANFELDTLMRRVGVAPRIVTSASGQVSRYTDKEAMDLFLMTYCGKVNKRLVEGLQRLGVNAVGLSALDGRIARGRRKPRIRAVEGGKTRVLDGDFAGSIEQIDTRLICLLLESGYLPVLTPPALSHEGEAINVDGDKLAMELAVALRARRLLIFSDTPGLLRDLHDPASTVTFIDADRSDGAVELAQGRMKKKILAAAGAARRGVLEVILADANQPDAVRRAIDGSGTHIRQGATHA